MKVTILGWYGHGNLGDEAMLEGLQYLFNSFFGPCEFTVFTDYETATVPRISEKVNESDLLVLGGGELINRNRLFLNMPRWERVITIPKVIVGCGVNVPKYEMLEDHVKESVRSFRFLGLRDDQSCMILREDQDLASKVHLSLDPSIILASKYGFSWKPQENKAAIIPTDRQHNRFDEGIQITNIVENTKFELKKQLREDEIKQITLLAFGGEDNDDMESCRKLAEYFAGDFHVSIIKPTMAKEALKILSVCSKVYSYRLHSMLLAYSMGVPFTCYGYHWKVKRVYNTIIDLTPKTALDIISKAWSSLKEILENDNCRLHDLVRS